ncbi:MAG: ComF family protein [Lachnospiraceae bacterium]|nr:ComF family protein [Lachnospiraceae bacterium]
MIGNFLKPIDLLYPRRCPVCDDAAPLGKKICPDCRDSLKIITSPWCMKCGKKLAAEGMYCGDCMIKDHSFACGRSLYEYKSVYGSIYRLKYENRREYAEYFGEEMWKHLKAFIKNTKAEGIVPIPLHKKRQKKRGYNQAYLLAKALSKGSKIPLYPNYLKRVKNTAPLKALSPSERQNNLKKAFIVSQNVVKLKSIIVVDDIYTTGSTMDEAATALLESGVREVFFVTLAGAGI